MRPLPPEVRVLIAACHLGGPPAPAEPLDVARLLRLAAYHRVAGLASEARGRLPLPSEAVDALRRSALATLHRNLQAAAELKIALRALRAAGVEAILLKGAHLMDAIYHNPALRPLSDLDILVQPHHAQPAMAALAAAGYRADPDKAAFGLARDGEARLEKTGVHDLVVEVHTTLNRATRHHWFPMPAIWQRSLPYEFDGEPARVLAPADNLCFLCAHAVPHVFGQLSWVRDIAGVWEMLSPQDRDALPAVAAASRTRLAAYAGLSVARDILGASVPAGTLDALAGRRGRKLHARLAPECLFGAPCYSTLTSLVFRAACADSRLDALAIWTACGRRRAAEAVGALTTRHPSQPLEA